MGVNLIASIWFMLNLFVIQPWNIYARITLKKCAHWFSFVWSLTYGILFYNNNRYPKVTRTLRTVDENINKSRNAFIVFKRISRKQVRPLLYLTLCILYFRYIHHTLHFRKSFIGKTFERGNIFIFIKPISFLIFY